MFAFSETKEGDLVTYNFKIMGRPRPKQSVRFSTRGFSYQSKKVIDNEKSLKNAFSQMWGKDLLTNPLRVSIYFYFKKFKKSKRDLHPLYFNSNPDIDNLAKSVLDGVKGVVIKDDDIICQLHLFKYFSDQDYMIVQISSLV